MKSKLRSTSHTLRGATGSPLAGGLRLMLVALLLLILSACAPTWEVGLVDGQGTPTTITRKTLRELDAFATEDGSILLEQVLYENGCQLIETLEVVGPDGQTRSFDWLTTAETTFWSVDGRLHLNGDIVPVAQLAVIPPSLPGTPTTGVLDIAPTVASVLGLPTPEGATGHPLPMVSQSEVAPRRIALIFLDAFGYVRYSEALEDGLIPNLAALPAPELGLTVYPPCTSVSSAAMLTGVPPNANGVATRGIRTTESETFFDLAAAAGLQGIAVEGNALAFNMRNADVTLSGDRGSDGGTDDDVLANAKDVLAQGMPDLLWIHFHGIDDVGHTYGPDTPEERAKIVEVDAAVGELLAALPPETAVLIFADHGMHAVSETGRLGNHGQLIARDMLVPVWAFVR